MNYKIKYAKEALNDLDSIFAFVSNVSTSGAKTVINKIRAKINKLTFMPSGLNFDARLGRRLHDKYKTEALISDNYLILFVVNEEKKVVIITHIIPSKSNYMRLLKK
ncbi:type II toxin-antitoxin system RelE/ParE family toxin [Streptococcus suis]|uniref:type II toxin-antitoxin system RelE/ParE family toxin n=1 Tax=Streptococcus suis TaxID=1307 RepID=UPI0019239875|nr:type II toxin-antitoxin system RelE/ParE family toxin [Streptococcus suis]MBL1125243.1 type II toxin-antitoxin system RelE/ParE family toxin [Streptococcus suis]MBY5025114.1 type II toxin-antitoxin system RelE/ParE family toxin [Streptococcus suis]QZT18320.1 type II toxin-antitoxin system RelE/ParE family toxin [Streptococcus suis]HEM3670218.1 type II toxin-antitoxin system RelE/ParE family toxin [Streptococcus suis]HEM3686360.1 type II toxin-antitoxin system RelE/ParE family toxin [Strepto